MLGLQSLGRAAAVGRHSRPHLLLQDKPSASAAAAAAATRSLFLNHQPCGLSDYGRSMATSACSAPSGPCSSPTTPSTPPPGTQAPMQSTGQAAGASTSAATGSPASSPAATPQHAPAASSHHLAASRRLCSHVKVRGSGLLTRQGTQVRRAQTKLSPLPRMHVRMHACEDPAMSPVPTEDQNLLHSLPPRLPTCLHLLTADMSAASIAAHREGKQVHASFRK